MLITEEALQTGVGHWTAYLAGITSHFRSKGDEVDVLCHANATPEVLERVGGTPWFSRNCWLDTRSQGGIGGLLHNFIFRQQVAKWLRKAKSYDWICALTMRTQHLLAFALLARSPFLPRKTRFLLLFVQGFGVYSGPQQPCRFVPNLSTRFARFCFHLLAPAVRTGRVILAAETKGMQEELGRFTGLCVSHYPHPVPPPSTRGHLERSDRSLTVTCPGFARYEKGTDLLQEAIRLLRGNQEMNHLHFVLQWLEPFEMPGGSTVKPDKSLASEGRVEYLTESLNEESYEDLLARSDLVIVPYRRESYHNRVSRVAIEAASRSIPLIYTAGTWSGEVAELAGAGVPITGESSEAVAYALRRALDGFARLKEEASEGASRVIDFHSAEEFRRLMAGQ
ncbi:hypothetical protein N9A89_06650 [Akkermansiaceae bacterium]|nr:hypothetical protein [Akkermansiaceae bacterium]MDA7936192.1 hypothetical protein [bacterium]